jgi:anhydro-N-acetylmuramic acid kinase
MGVTKALTAIGLMSGTSMDGVDAAVLVTDGETIAAYGALAERPYVPTERAVLREALVAARAIADRSDRAGVLAEAERMVTAAHAEAVEALFVAAGLSAADVDVVGFHGQTVLHRPEQRLTVQIGDAAALADRLRIPVVYDFRAADVAAGGQGAPLVPAYHRAIARRHGWRLPVAILNLGGVGNVTFVGEGDPVAFDTGPGNALIDDWVMQRAGIAFDEDGRIAAAGQVDTVALATLMDDAYFDRPPPKSLDRNDFPLGAVSALSLEDGAATLAAFTAASVAAAERWFPAPVRRWIVAGGGARNQTLLAMLSARLSAPVTTADAAGLSASHIEAQAFAYLAVRSLKGLPLSYPTTTGVPKAMTGGVVARAVALGR